MNGIREKVELLAAAPRETVADELIRVALGRIGVVSVDQAFRDAVLQAYDYGRLAVVRELLAGTIRAEQERVGGTVQ